MTTSDSFGQEGSDVSIRNHVSGEHEPEQPSATTASTDPRDTDWRPTCPECEGQVVAVRCEATCSECGLVVHVDALEREPTLQAQAPNLSRTRLGQVLD